jgi:DNA polymerase-3 subunit beta
VAAFIKALSGALVAAFGTAMLPLRERETQRIPSLGCAHLAADGDGLCITVTTFDATITTRLEAEAEGAVAVPLERLVSLVRNFPADVEITITADNNNNTATVKSGGSKFHLPVFPIADMLQSLVLGEETGCVELEAKIARDLFFRPAFAASTDGSRAYLAGVFLHNVGDNLVAVATDVHRLCRVTTPVATALSTDRSLIIENEMVKTINRLLGAASGNVTLRRSDRLFSVGGNGFAIVTKRIDATYPGYENLLSAETPNVVTTSRARLRKSIARFSAVADPQIKTHVVRLRWNADGLHLSAPDGSADCLAADVEGEAETAVSVRYLTDLVGAPRGDSVRLGAGGPGSLILVTDPDDESFTAAQMPMRWPS